MTSKRFMVVSDVHLVYIKDKKILLHRRCNTGYMDGYYHLPAGHIEEEEPASIALCREVREEVGIDLLPTQIQCVHVMHRRQDDTRMSTFWSPVVDISQTPINNEPHKCDDLQFFDVNTLPKNMVPYAQKAVEYILQDIHFSEFGW